MAYFAKHGNVTSTDRINTIFCFSISQRYTKENQLTSKTVFYLKS